MLFDSHAHLAPGPEALQTLLTTMDRHNIHGAVVVPGSGIAPALLAKQLLAQPTEDAVKDIRYNNEELLSQCKRSNGRLIPFFFANPYDPVDGYRRLGAAFAGLKFGPGVHGVRLHSPKIEAYIKVARDFRHPVYTHCLEREGFRVLDLVQLSRRFPLTTFILGHGGIGHLDLSAVDQIAPYPRILFETSGTFLKTVQYASDRLGSDRVLFGSEYPLQSPGAEIAKLAELEVTSEDRRNVRGRNIHDLLQGARR